MAIRSSPKFGRGDLVKVSPKTLYLQAWVGVIEDNTFCSGREIYRIRAIGGGTCTIEEYRLTRISPLSVLAESAK